MGSTVRRGLGALAWSALAYGALALRHVPGDYSHAFCVPWGCLPPIQALAAMHGFWLVVLTPPTLWAGRSWTSRKKRVVGRAAVLLALLGATAVIIYDASTRAMGLDSHGVLVGVRRAAVALATQVDLPLAPLLAAGASLWSRAAREPVAPGGERAGRDAQARPEGAGQVDEGHA